MQDLGVWNGVTAVIHFLASSN